MSKELLEPDSIYHIYNHAVGKDELFLPDDNYYFFLRRYQHFIPAVADTYAYCLMSNHLHVLVEIKSKIVLPENSKYSEGQFISKQFSNLFSSYSQAFNKQQNRMGNLFMSNFKRKKIESDEYLTRAIQYIHNNPVKHGITKHPSQWKFSSYNSLLSDKETFLKREKVIGWFGNLVEFRNAHESERSFPKA
jgi:REP element-mobilizing transposase RayT